MLPFTVRTMSKLLEQDKLHILALLSFVHVHTQVVTIERANTILGVRIMGGTDRPNHIFRQGDKPGIFVLHLLAEGAAAKCGSLRAGDRILTVSCDM